ncbi:MAG: glycosyltransferase family 1 protein [Actinobacteria bacterium]|nr:MAG: glycosyltransferase family 1 protein [Actinomycetota bacterium]
MTAASAPPRAARVLEIRLGPHRAPGLERLLLGLRKWCVVRADQSENPAARLVCLTAPSGGRVLNDAPLVVVDDRGAVPTARATDPELLHRAAVVLVAHGTPIPIERPDALFLPSIDAARHPPVLRFARERWRAAYGFPERFVVSHGCDPGSTTAAAPGPMLATTLALASAAAVCGPETVMALALATPVVTDEATANALGAADGVEVVVAPTPSLADRAHELAGDPARCARLGWHARRLVERHHDSAAVVRAVVQRLGFSDGQGVPGADSAREVARLLALDPTDAAGTFGPSLVLAEMRELGLPAPDSPAFHRPLRLAALEDPRQSSR